MKRPRHGSSWLALTPDELPAKLATLVPPPRVHAVRYHAFEHRELALTYRGDDRLGDTREPRDCPAPLHSRH